jgi:glycosyltransferase involved in cell wall biosynthesis
MRNESAGSLLTAPVAARDHAFAEPAAALPAAGPGHQLVIFSALPWTGHPQRQHELAVRLARDFDVYFVEPPQAVPPTGPPEFGPIAKGGDVHVIAGPHLSPLAARRMALFGVSRDWYRRKAEELRATLPPAAPGARLLWLDAAASVGAMGQGAEDLTVYDCVDLDWTFTRWPWKRRRLRRWEEELACRAEIAICSSVGLRELLPRGPGGSYVVPNACSEWHLQMAHRAPSSRPPATRPVLGFIGGLHARALDVECLRHVARTRPDWRLVLIGPCDPALRRRLGRQPNVELPGRVPHDQAQARLRDFDVGLIPYRVGGRIDYVYPKKLHEYLAAGRPVVATDMPELRPFRDVVRIGHTPDEFVRQIAACLVESADPARSARRIAARRAVARENTWEKRAEQIAAILNDALERRGFPRRRRAEGEDRCAN